MKCAFPIGSQPAPDRELCGKPAVRFFGPFWFNRPIARCEEHAAAFAATYAEANEISEKEFEELATLREVHDG